jgi:uncharacterized membrane protein
MPRWVKVAMWAIGIVAVLAVVVVVFRIGGEHGPGRHFGMADPVGSAAVPTVPAAVVPAAGGAGLAA